MSAVEAGPVVVIAFHDDWTLGRLSRMKRPCRAAPSSSRVVEQIGQGPATRVGVPSNARSFVCTKGS